MAEAFSTYGLIAAHYQFREGDGDQVPDPEHRNLAGGKFLTETPQDNRGSRTLRLANVCSGFVGMRLGRGVNRQSAGPVAKTHRQSGLETSIASDPGWKT